MGENQYVIRGGAEGRERLRLLSRVFQNSTNALLARVGVPPGARCLDVGCGGGDVTLELARMSGTEGYVLGVDFDATEIEIARSEAGEQQVVNAFFESQDVTEWAPADEFDVIYARFLLTHLAEPSKLLFELKQHIRPGGALIVEDIDFRGHFSEPCCPAFDWYVAWYSHCVTVRGADPNIGPRLPALLHVAGFRDINVSLFHPVALEGGIKQLTCMTLDFISEAILRENLASEAELAQIMQELEAYSRDPSTLIGGPRVFQVWSRLPT
jgi:SAM-dependent methyltransferase